MRNPRRSVLPGPPLRARPLSVFRPPIDWSVNHGWRIPPRGVGRAGGRRTSQARVSFPARAHRDPLLLLRSRALALPASSGERPGHRRGARRGRRRGLPAERRRRDEQQIAAQAPAPRIVVEAPTQTSADTQDLGFPAFATKNTTRVGGADPVADAAGVALAVDPSTGGIPGPDAVTLVDAGEWQGGIAAASLVADPVGAPVLITESGHSRRSPPPPCGHWTLRARRRPPGARSSSSAPRRTRRGSRRSS